MPFDSNIEKHTTEFSRKYMQDKLLETSFMFPRAV